MTRRLSRRQTCLYFGLATCLGLVLLTTGMEIDDRPRVLLTHSPRDPNFDPNLPVMMMFGVTGSGKSTFGNMINRMGDVRRKPIFDTSARLARETTIPTAHQILDLKGHKEMILIDTPGLGDTAGEDEQIRTKIVQSLQALKKQYKDFGVNSFVIVVNQRDCRFHPLMKDMITFAVRMFGAEFLDNVSIVLRSWPYTITDIDRLEREHKDEIENIQKKKTLEIRTELYKLLDEARDRDGWNITISQQRLDRIEVSVPVYFIDSEYDKVWDDKDMEEEEYSMAHEQVQRLLTNMKTTKRYSCLRMKDKIDSEEKQMEKELAALERRAQEMQKKVAEDKTKSNKKIMEMLQERERRSAENIRKLRDQNIRYEDRIRIKKEEEEEQRRCAEEIDMERREIERRLDQLQAEKVELAKKAKQIKKAKKQRIADEQYWSQLWTKIGAICGAVAAIAVQAIPVVGQVAGGIIGGVLAGTGAGFAIAGAATHPRPE